MEEEQTTQWLRKETDGQTVIYITLHRKLEIGQHEHKIKRNELGFFQWLHHINKIHRSFYVIVHGFLFSFMCLQNLSYYLPPQEKSPRQPRVVCSGIWPLLNDIQ